MSSRLTSLKRIVSLQKYNDIHSIKLYRQELELLRLLVTVLRRSSHFLSHREKSVLSQERSLKSRTQSEVEGCSVNSYIHLAIQNCFILILLFKDGNKTLNGKTNLTTDTAYLKLSQHGG